MQLIDSSGELTDETLYSFNKKKSQMFYCSPWDTPSWRRNLWFAMGMHFSWNSLEGLLGLPISGHPANGLFTVNVNGAALLTGGDFGLEGSIVTVLISLLISIPMLIGAARNQASLRTTDNSSHGH